MAKVRSGAFRGTTTRAGTFPPNRFGLYDMHGNVWEFCLDIASATYDDAPLDGSADLSGPPGEQPDPARRVVVAQPGDLPLGLSRRDRGRQPGLAGSHRPAGGVRIDNGSAGSETMTGERSLWFVTEVEAAETVEVVDGARSSEDVGGGFGSSLVQQTRKTLTQRVQITPKI